VDKNFDRKCTIILLKMDTWWRSILVGYLTPAFYSSNKWKMPNRYNHRMSFLFMFIYMTLLLLLGTTYRTPVLFIKLTGVDNNFLAICHSHYSIYKWKVLAHKTLNGIRCFYHHRTIYLLLECIRREKTHCQNCWKG